MVVIVTDGYFLCNTGSGKLWFDRSDRRIESSGRSKFLFKKRARWRTRSNQSYDSNIEQFLLASVNTDSGLTALHRSRHSCHRDIRSVVRFDRRHVQGFVFSVHVCSTFESRNTDDRPALINVTKSVHVRKVSCTNAQVTIPREESVRGLMLADAGAAAHSCLGRWLTAGTRPARAQVSASLPADH